MDSSCAYVSLRVYVCGWQQFRPFLWWPNWVVCLMLCGRKSHHLLNIVLTAWKNLLCVHINPQMLTYAIVFLYCTVYTQVGQNWNLCALFQKYSKKNLFQIILKFAIMQSTTEQHLFNYIDSNDSTFKKIQYIVYLTFLI